MLILEEDFRWHSEAFAPELFTHIYIYIALYINIGYIPLYIASVALSCTVMKNSRLAFGPHHLIQLPIEMIKYLGLNGSEC